MAETNEFLEKITFDISSFESGKAAILKGIQEIVDAQQKANVSQGKQDPEKAAIRILQEQARAARVVAEQRLAQIKQETEEVKKATTERAGQLKIELENSKRVTQERIGALRLELQQSQNLSKERIAQIQNEGKVIVAVAKQREQLLKMEADANRQLYAEKLIQLKSEAQAVIQNAKAQEQAIRQQAVAQKQAQAEFSKTLKTFGGEGNQVKQLVQTFGSFTVQLDRTKAATSQAEVEFRKLLTSSPALAKEIDNLANKFSNVASVEVSRAGFLPNIQSDKNNLSGIIDVFNQLGLTGAASLGGIALKFGAVGLAGLGVIKGLDSLKDAFISLAETAIGALQSIVAQAIETGKLVQASKLSLATIFEGDEKVAEAVFNRIRQLAEETGADATKLSRLILPNVESIDQFERVVKLAQGLLLINPEKNINDAIVAINELLTGQAISVQRRFNIDTTQIVALQKELGLTQGGIEGLSEALKQLGVDISDDALFDTFPALLGQVEQFAETLEGIAGEPILESLSEELRVLLEFVRENRESFLVLAEGFGEGVAKIVSALGDIGEDFLGSLGINKEDAIELATALSQLGDTAKLLAASLNFQGTDFQALSILTTIIDGLRGALLLLFPVLTQLRAEFAGLGAATNQYAIILRLVKGEISFDEFKEQIAAAERPAEAFNRAMIENSIQLGLYSQQLNQSEANIEQFVDSLADSEDGLLSQADAALAAREALEAANKAISEAGEELEKANEDLQEAQEDAQTDLKEAAIDATNKRLDAERDYMRRVMDIERETSQARIDAIRKNQQEIQDIYRENAQEIQDIYRENAQDVADANRDILRDVQDIFRKNSRKLSEIDEESADERIKIEEDFQRRIEEIRRKFEFDAEEAIRANDAIAYLRIQRRAQFELDEAERRRNEELEDEAVSSEEKREKAQEDLQREIEDAQIAHQRKLEDLQIALARDLEERRIALARRIEEANIALARELEQIKISEQRKREEAKIQLDRQIEDIKIAYDRKRAEIQRSLQDEIKAVNAAQQAMAAAERQKVQILQASTNQIVALYAKQAKAAQSVVGINRNRPPSSGDDNFGGGQTPPSKGYKPPIYVNPSPPDDDGGGNNRGLTVDVPQTLQSVLSPQLLTAPIVTSVTNPPELFSPPAPQTITRSIINSRNSEVPVTIYANDIFSPNQLRMLRNEIDGAIAEANRQ